MLTDLEAGILSSGSQHGWVLVRSLFYVVDFLLYVSLYDGKRARQAFGDISKRAFPSYLIISQRPHLHLHPIGIRILTVKFGEPTNSWSIAVKKRMSFPDNVPSVPYPFTESVGPFVNLVKLNLG